MVEDVSELRGLRWKRRKCTLEQVLVQQDGVALVRSTVSSRALEVEDLVELAAVEEVLAGREESVRGKRKRRG